MSGTWYSIHARPTVSNDAVRRTEAPGRRRPARRRRGPAPARPCAARGRRTTRSAPSSLLHPLGELALAAADLEHDAADCHSEIVRQSTSGAFGPSISCVQRLAAHAGCPRVAYCSRGRPVAQSSSRGQDRSTIGAPGMPLPGGAPAEPRVDGRADVGELAVLVDAARRVAALDVGEQQRVLARVVGRRRRRVAAVVRGEDEQVVRPQRVEQVGQPAVEVLEAAVEVHRVVAVAPERVGLDEVREDQPVVDRPQQLLGLLDALDVRLRRELLVDVLVGEDVADLADAVDLVARVADEREVVRAASARARSRAGSASARRCPARRRTAARSRGRRRASR